jgi:hypothetical protein
VSGVCVFAEEYQFRIQIEFVAGPYYEPQSATLNVTDNSRGSPQIVSLTAQTIKP